MTVLDFICCGAIALAVCLFIASLYLFSWRRRP